MSGLLGLGDGRGAAIGRLLRRYLPGRRELGSHHGRLRLCSAPLWQWARARTLARQLLIGRLDMAYWHQRTVAKRVTATGIGLHSGHPVTLTLAPAPADAGVTFVRVDLGVEIPARNEYVVDTRLNTTVGVGNARVSTVEHVMAALQGMGVDNCRVEVDGPEMPVLDGSAAPFVVMIKEAGLQLQRPGRRFVVVDRAVEVRDGDKLARIEPSDAFRVSFTADFDHPLITNQTLELTVSDRTFDREIS